MQARTIKHKSSINSTTNSGINEVSVRVEGSMNLGTIGEKAETVNKWEKPEVEFE